MPGEFGSDHMQGVTMNAIDMLLKDHKEIKSYFREFENAGDRAYAAKEHAAHKAFTELIGHSKCEEDVFYPALKEAADKEGKGLVLEAVEEHHMADSLIQQLKALSAKDETYDAKFKVLIESVEHHIEEEESEMFPEAKRLLAGQLDDLGKRIAQIKEGLKQANAA
jgi:hemerythrin-like domain-containing protein